MQLSTPGSGIAMWTTGDSRRPLSKLTYISGLLLSFGKNPIGVIALMTLLAFYIAAILPLLFTSIKPNEIDLSDVLRPPSSVHLFGTDQLGRDVLSRILDGARMSLIVGPLVAAGGLCIGVLIGAPAGHFGGRLDNALMRLVDISLALPAFPIMLLMASYLGSGLITIAVLLIAFNWQVFARVIRGQFLTLREREFITAARATGVPDQRIILRHLIPNAIPHLIVITTLCIADAMIVESVLSFLGLGLGPPQASWGNMLSDGQSYLLDAPWLVWFPGLCISIVVVSYNYLGESLRIYMSHSPSFRGA